MQSTHSTSSRHAAISVEKLSKSYGSRRSISDLTFEVPVGAICGFVGPNGSGKSTTMRALLSLISTDSGEALIFGESVKNPARYLHRVGSMIEAPALYPALTGRENLQLFASLSGIRNLDYRSLLARVGLGDRANSTFKSYSLGMKQRLAIATALIGEPELLILDEPMNGLDPTGIAEIRLLLQEFAASGRTIFISSHLLRELEALCDYFVMIRDGKTIFSGGSANLAARNGGELVVRPEFSVDLGKLHQLALEKGLSSTIVGQKLQISEAGELAADFNRWASELEITVVELTQNLGSLEQRYFQMESEA